MPLEYEFGVPVTVRTLLREFNVLDGEERVQPAYVELGNSMIEPLVSWLLAATRHLPVVVVSRTLEVGTTRIDERALGRELAGIAHVRVLASEQAAWTLTDLVGQPLSVWGGAVCVYFPGFSRQDDPYRHWLWLGEQVNVGLIPRLRSWLGTLSASRTAQHPVHEQLWLDRHFRLEQALASDDRDFLWEEIGKLEEGERPHQTEMQELERRNADLTTDLERLSEELEAVRRSFADAQRSVRTQEREPVKEEYDRPLTVVSAIEDVAHILNSRYLAPSESIQTDRLE